MLPEIRGTDGEAQILVALAGPAAGRWRCGSGKVETAQHEAGHACIGRALGLHVGIVSCEPVEDVLGFAQVSTRPIAGPPTAGAFTRGRFITDYRAAAFLISVLSPGWRPMLREVRSYRERAVELIEAHWDVIAGFASELFDRGAISGSESGSTMERIEAQLNAEMLQWLAAGEIAGFAEISTIARVRAAAVQLARDSQSKHERLNWARIAAAADSASERRGCTPGYLDRLGTDQASAVQRLIATHGRRAVAIAA